MSKKGVSLGLVKALVSKATGADPAVIEQAVQDWLDDHPEATTTVADGSITEQKLAAAVAAKINQVTQLSDEIDDIGSDVTDLKSAIDTIASFTDEYTNINQNSDLFTVRNGYYTGPNGWVEGASYCSYYFITDKKTKLYWDTIPNASTNYTQISVFSNCDSYDDASSDNFVGRYRNSDNTLPTEINKLEIEEGCLVVISVWVSANAFSCFVSNGTKATLTDKVSLSNTQIQQVIESVKKPFFRYISGAGNDSSTERIEIFIPTTIGYVMYQFVHTVNAEKNANIWRMAYAMAYDDTLTKRFDITTQGEWECALHLNGRADFSGGLAHGDEIYNSIAFWVDGKKMATSDFSGNMQFDELVITEASALYDPNDSETVIAQHGSKHIFKRDGLQINQTINWLINDSLTACFLAMFPPAKAVTNAYYTNKDYSQKTITTYPIEESKTTDATIYSTESGVTARFAINDYPIGYGGGDLFIIHDNGTGNYNKCYYAISYQATPSITSGTQWRSKTIYNIDVVK